VRRACAPGRQAAATCHTGDHLAAAGATTCSLPCAQSLARLAGASGSGGAGLLHALFRDDTATPRRLAAQLHHWDGADDLVSAEAHVRPAAMRQGRVGLGAAVHGTTEAHLGSGTSGRKRAAGPGSAQARMRAWHAWEIACSRRARHVQGPWAQAGAADVAGLHSLTAGSRGADAHALGGPPCADDARTRPAHALPRARRAQVADAALRLAAGLPPPSPFAAVGASPFGPPPAAAPGDGLPAGADVFMAPVHADAPAVSPVSAHQVRARRMRRGMAGGPNGGAWRLYERSGKAAACVRAPAADVTAAQPCCHPPAAAVGDSRTCAGIV